jgi:diketogulonate reductase-like aldo/keto reductase
MRVKQKLPTSTALSNLGSGLSFSCRSHRPFVGLLLQSRSRSASISRRKPACVAPGLAWILAQKPWIVPIPGTIKLNRVEENIGAAAVEPRADDIRDIENAVSANTVQGDRYSPQQAARIDR